MMSLDTGNAMSLVEPKNMSGGIFWRNDTGYEHARRSAVSNGRKPNRFPDVIVRAQSNGDVVAAVQLAKERGLKIGIRSGGHSWAASFLRDGGMLLDLSQMNGFSVDVSTRTATIQPGLKGADLNRALLKDRLFFPSGHCMPVSLGGFLLQGGFGWNSRLWGRPAVASSAWTSSPPTANWCMPTRAKMPTCFGQRAVPVPASSALSPVFISAFSRARRR